MKKSKSKSSYSNTQTVTPNVPSWIQAPYTDFAGSVGGLIGSADDTASYTVGPSANQTRGWAMAGGGGGADVMRTGLTNLGQIGDVNYDSLAQTDLTPYMNPFTQNVIDASMGDLERGRQQAIARGQAAATASGSYGGSRHGVADSLTNREFADSAGLLSANLRAQGFDAARQGAMFDIGNRYQAGTDNAARRMAIAQGLISGGGLLDSNARANADQLMQAGADERELSLLNNPVQARLRYLANIGGLLGMIPASTFTGGTTTGSGTSKESSSGFGVSWNPKSGLSFG